jgi:hypothetical protein
MSKPLNLTPADRTGCTVTYNVNRFEVFHADGWMMTAASSKADLKEQLATNQLVASFDDMAATKYLGATV